MVHIQDMQNNTTNKHMGNKMNNIKNVFGNSPEPINRKQFVEETLDSFKKELNKHDKFYQLEENLLKAVNDLISAAREQRGLSTTVENFINRKPKTIIDLTSKTKTYRAFLEENIVMPYVNLGQQGFSTAILYSKVKGNPYITLGNITRLIATWERNGYCKRTENLIHFNEDLEFIL